MGIMLSVNRDYMSNSSQTKDLASIAPFSISVPDIQCLFLSFGQWKCLYNVIRMEGEYGKEMWSFVGVSSNYKHGFCFFYINLERDDFV